MRWTVWGCGLLGATAGVAAAAALGQGTGPTAVYWVSASTESGAGTPADEARPGLADMVGRGGDLGSGSPRRSLELRLAAETRPTGAPRAEHDPPPGLGLGQRLALASPGMTDAGPFRPLAERPAPEDLTARPKGRILMYWGCGEHAGPGQPVVVDLVRPGPGAPTPRLQGRVEARPETPPPALSASYGHWPQKTASPPGPDASLIGPHAVRSNYAPDIAFTLGPQMEFMPALELRAAGTTPSGAARVVWTPLAQATGYHLSLTGGSRGRDGGGEAVYWSSSRLQPAVMGGALNDYLPPGEVARLVSEKAVLAPGEAECLVPAEVTAAAPSGLLRMIAYGPEANFADPPRPAAGPWRIRWTAKVRLKSLAAVRLAAAGPRSPGTPSRLRLLTPTLR